MRVMRKILIALFAGTVIGFVPMFAEQAEAQRFGGRGGGVGMGRSCWHRRRWLRLASAVVVLASVAPAGAAVVLSASAGAAVVLAGAGWGGPVLRRRWRGRGLGRTSGPGPRRGWGGRPGLSARRLVGRTPRLGSRRLVGRTSGLAFPARGLVGRSARSRRLRRLRRILLPMGPVLRRLFQRVLLVLRLEWRILVKMNV